MRASATYGLRKARPLTLTIPIPPPGDDHPMVILSEEGGEVELTLCLTEQEGRTLARLLGSVLPPPPPEVPGDRYTRGMEAIANLRRQSSSWPPAAPGSSKVRCPECGRTGYPGGSWVDACLTHVTAPCGKVVSARGLRVHAVRCGCLPEEVAP